MKSLSKVCLFALSALFLAACSSTKPLTMDMSLEKGATFDYAITTTNNMGMSMMGQDMSTTGKSVQDYNFVVKGIQPTGATDVDFKISRMTVDLTVPMMGDMSYDSQKGEGDSSSPFAGLGGMIGKTMQASFDRKGKVTNIDGADVIMKEVLGKMKGGEQMTQMLDTYIGEESFKTAFSTLTGFSQGKVLKVGDTWTKTIDTKSGVTLASDYTYTIRERKDGKVTIDVSGESKSDPNAKPIEAQGMKISYNLSGPITGVIVVDEKTGWAETSDIEQNLSGKLKLGGTPMGDMNLDAKMKIGVSAKRK
ncbi:MAG: DUF6263 family protein [Bacteroidota bacterium]